MAKDLTATTLNSFRRHGGFLLAHPSRNNLRSCQCCGKATRRFRMAWSRLTPLLMRIYWATAPARPPTVVIIEW